MKDLRLLCIYRSREHERQIFGGTDAPDKEGCFFIPSPIDKAPIAVIACSSDGWDHVSCSRANRCPNWPEMDHIKRLFFKDNEVAMQLHVANEDHISIHPYTLHLWRPHYQPIPLPPKKMV